MEPTIYCTVLRLKNYILRFAKLIRESMMQDQLLTREGALKMAEVSNATLMKAINDGIYSQFNLDKVLEINMQQIVMRGKPGKKMK